MFSGMIAIIVLLAWDLATPDPTLQPTLLSERFLDTLIAAALAAFVTLLFFPRESWSVLMDLFGSTTRRESR
jgi:uncharacterized membrane protein YccC